MRGDEGPTRVPLAVWGKGLCPGHNGLDNRARFAVRSCPRPGAPATWPSAWGIVRSSIEKARHVVPVHRNPGRDAKGLPPSSVEALFHVRIEGTTEERARRWLASRAL